MSKNGGERFPQTRAAAHVALTLLGDDTVVARLLRRVFDENHQRNRDDRHHERRDAEEPMPIVFRHDPGANSEAGENDRREIVDRDLAELNHEAENAGESPALCSAEPSGVHLHHPGRAERLKVTVHQPDRGESGEGPRERSEAEDEIDRDRAGGSDDHRRFTADPIC